LGVAAGLRGVSDYLRDPSNPGNAGNVTGGLPTTVNPDLTYSFSGSTLAVKPSNGTAATSGCMLILAANVPTPPANTTGGKTTPIGPDFTFPNTNISGSVTTFTNNLGGQQTVINGAANGSANALSYSTNTATLGLTLQQALPNQGANGLANQLQSHVIILQRLANPYMAYSATTNPYITVDTMDSVPTADRILRANNQVGNRQPYSGGQPHGYNPNPASLGKVQPYTAWTTPNLNPPAPPYSTGTYNFQFPNSLVLAQRPSTPYTQSSFPSGVNTVLQTFGYYNSIASPNTPPSAQTYTTGSGTLLGKETIMSPFDWFTHLDRPLINQTEIMQVSMGKPHEYTQRTIVPNTAGNDVQKFGYMAFNAFSTTMLYRALDLLRVQPYGQMMGLGGRVPGRINVNTTQDKRVIDALFDDHPNVTGFQQSDVTQIWNSVITGTRSVNSQPRYSTVISTSGSGTQLTDTGDPYASPTVPATPYSTPIPAATVYDTPTPVAPSAPGGLTVGKDRPFLAFGGPTFSASGVNGFAFTQGGGINDTLLRTGMVTTFPNGGSHPYQQAEAVRKILNNTTTVSHTFAVWVTVGYFEYNQVAAANKPVLGAEYYQSVPGDLRRKFFAVVDRSLVGLDPLSVLKASATAPAVHSQNQPVFTTVAGTGVTPAGSTLINITSSSTGTDSVYSNGTKTTLSGNWIAIGTGSTREIVQLTTASSASQPATGSSTTTGGYTVYTVTSPNPKVTGLQFPHWPGECVSNIIPGNPGQQINVLNTGTSGQLGNGISGNFNYSQTPYSYIVPFTIKLQ
jgi:hypothetical protein